MPETSNTIVTVGLSRETASHAKLLERSAQLDQLEFHLLNYHLVNLEPSIVDLHQRKSNIIFDFDGVT